MTEPLVIPIPRGSARQPAKWAPGPAIESVEELLEVARSSRAERFVWWGRKPMHAVYAINMSLIFIMRMIRTGQLRHATPNPAYVAWLRAELERVS